MIVIIDAYFFLQKIVNRKHGHVVGSLNIINTPFLRISRVGEGFPHFHIMAHVCGGETVVVVVLMGFCGLKMCELPLVDVPF